MTHTLSESEMKALREITAAEWAEQYPKELSESIKKGEFDQWAEMRIAKAAFGLGRETERLAVLGVIQKFIATERGRITDSPMPSHARFRWKYTLAVLLDVVDQIGGGQDVKETAEPATAPHLSDGWSRYDGTGMPVPGDAKVWIKIEGGEENGPGPAKFYDWFVTKGLGLCGIEYWRLDDPGKGMPVSGDRKVWVGKPAVESWKPGPDPMSRPLTVGMIVEFLDDVTEREWHSEPSPRTILKALRELFELERVK